MNITINDSVLTKYGLSLEEFLVLFLCSRDVDFSSISNSLIDKGIAEKDLFNKVQVVVSDNTKELISSVLIDSDNAVIDKDEEFLAVAKEMQQLFPEGRKPGTTYFWRDSAAVIAKKLKTVVVKFNFQFTKEQALEATRRYVKSFNGDYQYMQLLKYFILKTDMATKEIRSDFMSVIENMNQHDDKGLNDEWLTTLK